MRTCSEKARAERICDAIYRVCMSLLVLLLVAVVSGTAVRYLGAPKVGQTYYSTRMGSDFTEDTVLARPVEIRGRYVRYKYRCQDFCDSLDIVCSIMEFNAAYRRYRGGGNAKKTTKTDKMKNISEILKNAPKGILLYSPVFGYVNLVGVTDKVGARDKIIANIQFGKSGNAEFDSFGKYSVDGECVLFPSKFHKTWDDWQESLLSFGDFITNIDGYKETFVIYKTSGDGTCDAYDSNGSKTIISKTEYRWATDEEKNGFLAELGRNGLIWNPFTNEMEIKPEPKPKFKPVDKKPYFLKDGRYYMCTEDFYVNPEHQDSLFKCGEICHSDEDNTVKNRNGCMFIDGHDGNAEACFQEIDTSNKELAKVKQYAYERWHELWKTIPDADKPDMTKEDLNNLGRFMEIEQLNDFLGKL